jgi:hypothetical protein
MHATDSETHELRSPHAEKLFLPILLSEDTPDLQSKELDVIIPTTDTGRIDDFMDDGVAVVLDKRDTRQ